MPLTVQALDHLVVQVSDLEASAKWYERVLGMTREDRVASSPGKPPRTAMKFGRQKINLRPIAASKQDWFTADHEGRRKRRLVLSHRRAAGRSRPAFRRKASPSRNVGPVPGRARHADRRYSGPTALIVMRLYRADSCHAP